MANENFLNITELDFEGIKNNFKEYLRSKQKFNGYDFEGSSMNILFDILAYNTHYSAFYASMVGNEMFIDSATKRDSVVSHAKLLNYVPRSMTSAKATINLRRTSVGTINRGDIIVGSYTNENNQTISKIFTFLEDYEYTLTNGNYVINNALIYEGLIQSLTYVFDSRLREKKFLVPKNADISTIRVKVRQSAAAADDDTEAWYRATDFSLLGAEEKVFFLQAAYDGQYEIYFGDGVLGKALTNGNIVYIEYLQSSGEEGNYFSSFVPPSSTQLTLVSPAVGGASPEDITEIRKNAPKAFVAQNRSVTARDYESIVLSLYPQAETVKVWGGEENDPPQFGKVFVSIKPNGGDTISDADKRFLLTALKDKAVVGIVPEAVDPEYLYGILNVTTNFNPSKTTLSRNEISALQRAKIVEYFDNTLEKFDTSLYLSKLNKLLDEVDSSILGTTVKTLIEQRIRPSTKYPTFVDLKFYNQIFHPYPGHKGSVRSSLFTYRNSVGESKACYIEDDGYGNLHIVTGEGGGKKTVEKNAGEIDYFTGSLVLFKFKPVNYISNDHIKIRIQPITDDIFAMKNKIIKTDTGSVNIFVYTKEETERFLKSGGQDFRDSLNTRGLIPDGPVVVSAGTIQSPSPFYVPNVPPAPPLPNAVPITLPNLNRIL